MAALPVRMSALVSALLASACASGVDTAMLPPEGVAIVPAYAETAAVASNNDAADDPAIWVNQAAPDASLVFGTDKQSGLYIFDLSGAKKQFLPAGKLNNVDIRQNIRIGGFAGDLAAASNRSDDTVTFFAIDPATGQTAELARLPTEVVEPYGFCLGYYAGAAHAIVTYKDGLVQDWAVTSLAGGAVQAKLGKGWKFETQLEGCSVDETNGYIFIGEEDRGVWKAALDGSTPPQLIDTTGSETGLTADVEGIGLWVKPDGEGYVVVSSQGSSTFNVYQLKSPNRFVGRFGVEFGEDIVTGTDGVDVVSVPMGANLPKGLFVTQDDINSHPDAPQNFKFVDWREIEKALETK
ncbi:MAG: phytase [Hyphomonadaceae bacterium]